MSYQIKKRPLVIQTSFIPVDKSQREQFVNELFVRYGIKLPNLDGVMRKNMREQDLMVLTNTVHIMFRYNGEYYSIKFLPGFVWDCGSVPKMLVHGDLSKFGQHIELPSMVHDFLFATKTVPFSDANDIFREMLKDTGMLTNRTVSLYYLGVSSFVGKRLYDKGNPETYWGNGYVEYEKL